MRTDRSTKPSARRRKRLTARITEIDAILG